MGAHSPSHAFTFLTLPRKVIPGLQCIGRQEGNSRPHHQLLLWLRVPEQASSRLCSQLLHLGNGNNKLILESMKMICHLGERTLHISEMFPGRHCSYGKAAFLPL